MKMIKSIKSVACVALLAATAGFGSCDFLDVVPPEQAGLKDATRDFDASQRFLYSCYAGVTNPIDYSILEASADEWVLPPMWNETMHKILYGLNTAANLADGWRWGSYYRYVGQCHLFLKYLPEAKGLTEGQRREWEAEANFMLAYYHMQVLNLYGPCPITDSYIPQSTSPAEYNGRSHYDYVVNWIVAKLDEAAAVLPPTRTGNEVGRATSVMAKALKARLLVYAASPLWNGSFPYPGWENTRFETPGYGKALVSYQYDRAKWERAEAACQDALAIADGNGVALYTDEAAYERHGLSLPFVPGRNPSKEEDKAFLKKVYLMRYVVTTRVTEGNKEIIWGLANQGNIVRGSMPHFIQMKSNNTPETWGYSGVSPILNTTVEYFYTKNGKRPSEDPSFAERTNWFKTAGISGRPDIITLNVDREPRFYAWLAFDGGDYGGPKLANGSPMRLRLKDAETQGYNPDKYNRDNNVTGYMSQKYVQSNLQFDLNGQRANEENKPRPLIRMAELYLNLAECYAALGKTSEAITNLNIIRNRAGVPDLTDADVTSSKTIMDWVRNERFIELWGEGHRYYDVRRWMIAPQTMGARMRTGLNAYGKKNPSFAEFNTEVVVDQPFMWNNRMYLLPVFYNEVYKNPQMVQAPGY